MGTIRNGSVAFRASLFGKESVSLFAPNIRFGKLLVFTWRQMEQYDFIMPTQQSIIRPTIEKLLLISDMPRLNIVAQTISTTFSRSYVRSIDTIWVISKDVVLEDIQTGGLAALPVDTSETLDPVGMTLRAESTILPALEFVMNKIRREAKKFY